MAVCRRLTGLYAGLDSGDQTTPKCLLEGSFELFFALVTKLAKNSQNALSEAGFEHRFERLPKIIFLGSSILERCGAFDLESKCCRAFGW